MLTRKQLKKKYGDVSKIFIVGSPRMQSQNDIVKSCYYCQCPVYLMDSYKQVEKDFGEKNVRYICTHCFMFFGPRGEIVITNEQAKKFGLSKKVLKEIAENIFSERGPIAG